MNDLDDLKTKKGYFVIITIIVIIILLSNLGQNFKTDNFSFSNTITNYSNMYSYYTTSKTYEEYISKSSSYIERFLKGQGLKPLNNSFKQKYTLLMPSIQHQSTLEVISKYGKTVKKFKYGVDFIEDFRGKVIPGIFISTPQIIEVNSIDLNKIKYKSSIALTDIYRSKNLYEIYQTDNILKNIGISAVISPVTGDLVTNSNLYNGTYFSDKEGLTKLIVTQKVYDELKYLISKGYEVKLKSGGEIKETNLINIYGVIEGKNKLYNPIVIAVFYDGDYKLNGSQSSISTFLPTSIMIEAIRAIRFQTLIKPDRTIIFAFLSGYNQNKYGLSILQNNLQTSDLIVLEDVGMSSQAIVNFSKDTKDLASTIEYYLKRNQINILSKNIDFNGYNKYTNIAALSQEQKLNSLYISKWGKFLLDVIGNTSYNLDFLTGNFYRLRLFKNFIREHSSLLSLITLVFLIYVIFKRNKRLT
ncbi:MAG: hypothetical protein N2594_02170 [Clostridiales bacterium]|nr:hypothetical protein [Clostridiales bacterium]